MRHPLSLIGLALAATLALSAHVAGAQDGGGSREREALRRTQAALRDAQQQQAALSKEKSDLAAQRDQLDEAAKRAQSQLSSARAEAARLNSTLAHAADELAAAKAQDEAARQAAQAQIAELSARLARSERVADERTKSNAALVALLTQATRSLAAAEKANREMHAFGLQLIDRVRGRSVADGTIAIEAEGLRDQLDAMTLANVNKAPAGSK
jgi:chromosome segregation ATPase